MFCHKCGTQVPDDVYFCQKCGAKVWPPNTGDTQYEEEASYEKSYSANGQKTEGYNRTFTDESPYDPPIEDEPSKFKKWWDGCSKIKKVLSALAGLLVGGIVLYFIVSFLREFGYILLGILVLLGLIAAIFIGTKEEKIEARKTLIQIVTWVVIVGVISAVIVLKPDFILDIIEPGANVRNAYLTQYSETITIEDAFDDFFSNGKWDTYKSEGYSYVVFTGGCEFMGEEADARITFKITGERFQADSLDINGVEQNNLALAMLLTKVYENY